MAWLGLGVFYTGVIVGIPMTVAVAEGTSRQRQINEEAANEDRMMKFYLDVFCAADSPSRDEVHAATIVLKHDKVWLAPMDGTTLEPKPLKDGTTPHPFTGFYIIYPDEERSPAERGLVSTISIDPPMLNWIYVDSKSHELKYGNKTQSIMHTVGPWDWTEDEKGLIIDGWEGFAAVLEEEKDDGLKWAIYYDRWNDDFGNGRTIGNKQRLQCSLKRRVLPEELVKAQEDTENKKMQVKSSGDLKTKWG